LQQPAVLAATATKTNVTCYGGTNGTAGVTASGGTSPYSYSWTGISATTSSVAGLSAKTYTATITDAKGCVTTASVIISQPPALAATSTATGPVCNNGTNGSATVNVSGGTAPYSYSWGTLPVQTGTTATALASGTYVVTVTDAAGCLGTFTVAVPVTPPVTVTVVPYWVSCFGGKDGSAKAFAANSTAPYTYVWNTSPVQTGDSAKGLSAGSYTVTVTSAIGCIGTATVNIQEPPILDAKLIAKGTCPGFIQGSISANVTGGNTPYSYAWNTTPVQTTGSISGLAPGSYFLTVTDNRGCTDTVSATVPLFSLPDVDAGKDDTVCRGSGITLTASGATTYTWSPAYHLSCDRCASTIASPDVDTTYIVAGTDANGCSNKDTVEVTVIQHVPVSAGDKHTICEGDSVQLNVLGGVAWEWLPPVANGANSSKPVVRPITTTTYYVVVVENKCFKDTLWEVVEVLPTPTVDLGPDLEAPNGSIIQLNAVAHNASTIAWIPETGLSCNNCFTPDLTVHGKATYIARVTNILGCAATDTINIRDVCDDHSFFFANVFTPNGDGANDRFYPQGVGSFPVTHFMIYDRWGEVVFSASNIAANDASAGWDGTYKGQMIKPDVYVYVMDALCENGQKVVIRGDVTLVR
jgi:gliding motility-associated-like protein